MPKQVVNDIVAKKRKKKKGEKLSQNFQRFLPLKKDSGQDSFEPVRIKGYNANIK